jgi:hypothetical protein
MPTTPGKKAYGLNYVSNKKQYQFCSRDFMEKGFNFYSDGKFYRYSTSIDNSEVAGAYDQDGPIRGLDNPNETVRGFTIYNLAIMQRNEKNEIYVRTITQCDFKITVPGFMLKTFLPNATKGWYDNIVKYYTKNNKKL